MTDVLTTAQRKFNMSRIREKNQSRSKITETIVLLMESGDIVFIIIFLESPI